MLPTVTRPLLAKASPIATVAAWRQLHSSPARFAAAGAVSKAESNHWKAERLVSAATLAVIPAAAVVGPSMPLDMAMAVLIPLHSYWGFDQVIIDYVKGPLTTPSQLLWGATSAATAAGLVYFNLNDVGITKAVQMLWAL
eukprot:comp12278_c0_seq1/m.7100 comp12278_c0_seq1/g.7100  ORF comp12278_c0_seq1/g.7100 comp12278_c0_seq1/m.7100 type:complete len:140 (-) comp12278_c0_seq1:344-763(-)